MIYRPWHAFSAGLGPGEVAAGNSEAGASGLRSLASAGKAAMCSSDPELQQAAGVAAYARSIIGVCTLLPKLNSIV